MKLMRPAKSGEIRLGEVRLLDHPRESGCLPRPRGKLQGRERANRLDLHVSCERLYLVGAVLNFGSQAVRPGSEDSGRVVLGFC